MRKAIFLLVSCLLLGSVYAQSQNKITVSFKNMPLKKAIDSISMLVIPQHLIQYNPKALRPFTVKNFSIKGADVYTTLDSIFLNFPITYKVVGPRIVIVESNEININGKITDQEDGKAVENANITVKETGINFQSDSNGMFRIPKINREGTLVISHAAYAPYEVRISGRRNIGISLISKKEQLAQVTVSDGFQTKNKERSPGSFVKIDKALINRSTSSKILDRLEGITSSYQPSANHVESSNQPQRTIRGISTINAYSEPLVIVDNFPYDGNIENINPNDVESITIARDAAAASIWGAFAGNGVIIITTKKGKYDKPVKVTLNSIITTGGKPDLYYTPSLNSREYVEAEEYLFNLGNYDAFLSSPTYPAVSPVVEILDKQRRGLISETEAKEQLDLLRQYDSRTDRQNYFYRNIFSQQYALSLTGGTKNISNYLSIGFDQDMSNLKRNKADRVTITGNNSYKLLKDKLELTTGIVFTQNTIDNNNSGLNPPVYPYVSFTDAKGKTVPVIWGYRPGYIDTAGAGYLLNWKYNPIDELNAADNRAKRTHYRVNLGLDFKVTPTVQLLINYQYTNETYEQNNIRDTATYYTRDLINQFTQINFQTGQVYRPIPVGSILDKSQFSNIAHNVRVQGKWNTIWKDDHELNAIGGVETRIIETQLNSNRLYGYNKSTQASMDVNYDIPYPIYNYAVPQQIPDNVFNLGTTDHYFSIFTNAAYTYRQRYTFSASARKDQSNLFGINTNRNGIPLWSVGASWEITRDIDIRFLERLRLRATHGYMGNIDKTISAYTTAKTATITNAFNAIPASIVNPPNRDLTWEKVGMTNLGIDFSFPNNVVNGSFEYYFKKGNNLIGYSEVDPTTGVSIFRGNSAGLKASGFDIIVNTILIDKKFGWKTTLLLSHVKDKVTRYTGGSKLIRSYADEPYFNPKEGSSLYSIYSYRFAGLNAEGQPVGSIVGSDTTTDYNAILSSNDFDNLIDHGSATPTMFGSLRNTISFKNFELSVNILIKTGYYFMRSTINYEELGRGSSGHIDYSNRWQQPGDENKTNVPAFIFPPNRDREIFYNRTSILVEKGDHIRVQDIVLSYTANDFKIGKLKVPAKFRINATNIGVLWKATKTSYDPDFVLPGALPKPLTISAGLSLTF